VAAIISRNFAVLGRLGREGRLLRKGRGFIQGKANTFRLHGAIEKGAGLLEEEGKSSQTGGGYQLSFLVTRRAAGRKG